MANRLISVTWTIPAITTGVTGYNVYLVNGAAENSTKTFLAFNNGINNNTFNYTATEAIPAFPQLQFEVRSTDGTNESPPLEIFYPQGTSLYTPTLITPSGNPMQIPRDQAYLTKDEYINYPNGLKLSNTSSLYTTGVLDTILQSASEEVNTYCHRHFQTQTIDQVYSGIRIGQDMPKLITVPLNEGPIQVVNRVDIQVLKFFIPFSLEYLQVFPDMGYIQLVPFLGGGYASGIPLPSAMLVTGLLGKIWVNYTAGFDIVPYSIKLATSLLATYFIGLQENPVGAKEVSFGRNFRLQWDKDHNPVVLEARRILEPYRQSIYRRP